MQQYALSAAQGLLYFNVSVALEIKNGTYSLFCDTWERIPSEDQQVIEEHLEFIVIKPINDPLHPDTVAFTRKSPTQPTWTSWMMWYPLFPIANKKELNMFCLAHELAHVYLQHPQRGNQVTTQAENEFKRKAEDEAHSQTSKWGFLRPNENIK
jgi:hypothetical protein